MTIERQPWNDKTNSQASVIAMADIENFSSQATSLIQYSSRGRVAVIGPNEALEFASRLGGNLTAQVILTDGAVEPGVPTIPVGNRQLKIEGYLGCFTIHLGDEGKANYEVVSVDLILDLSATPVLSMPVKPPGYLVSVSEEPYLTQVEDELKELTGTFEKPKYFDYDASICAHGRSGIPGCTKCIDSCPTEAIRSLVETIEVNANLCQGGGVCASVCPTGAIRYVYPDVKDTLAIIRTLLASYLKADGRYPVIAFITEADFECLSNKPANLLPVVVEELASVGMEVWLSALAYGAKKVLIINAGSMLDRVSEFLQLQLKTASTILQGLGYQQDAIRFVDDHSLHQHCYAEAGITLNELASYTGSVEKRRNIFSAIDHLFQYNETAQHTINLPEQSPFGRIIVDANKCTLCMSCASVCPSKAISAGNEVPKLEFTEVNCVQCGICATACPEQAITLQARIIAGYEQRRATVVLHEEAPFLCIQCGKPFATKSLIDTMTKKLAGHYMFKSERAKQRLMMCEDCRVVDAVQDEETMRSV